MSIQYSKFNKQKKFSHPYCWFFIFFFILEQKSFFYIFLLHFFSLAHFLRTSHSFLSRNWIQLEEGKLNWLENCFQIQIFKFHLYTSRCLRIKKEEWKKKRGKNYKSPRATLSRDLSAFLWQRSVFSSQINT